ncbi:hypothetical protein T484DRAFT_1871550 [Baffinella frigidus]|nr:hypothetical protein T484DRAFT_1871550 [Cryptophyta sp. CCMP2293]
MLDVTTSIALLVSFFSLTSSMFTNIHEQGKEIGLFRVVGVTRPWIARKEIGLFRAVGVTRPAKRSGCYGQ